MWRLLLVDDHALFREGLAGLLAYQDDFKVVGQAEDADGGLAEGRRVRPDVVLMDIDLPREDGVSATRRIKAALPEATVVMLTRTTTPNGCWTRSRLAMRLGSRWAPWGIR
jgi:DNA-binding NarL/FixJ family response regulator